MKNSNRMFTVALYTLLVMPAASQQTLSGTGKIQGSVLTPEGTALAGVSVIYTKLSLPPPGLVPPGSTNLRILRILNSLRLPVIHSSVVTAADGSFEISGLPSGGYTLCFDVPGGGFLDPCRWAVPEGMNLADGQWITGRQVRLQRGAIVQVRVSDPLLLLPQTDGPTAPKLIIGVRTASKSFHLALTASRDASGRTLRVTVPFDTPLGFWIFTRDVRLTDQSGNTLNAGGTSIPFRVGAGEAGKLFMVNVIGSM